jgi:hypothetical protein
MQYFYIKCGTDKVFNRCNYKTCSIGFMSRDMSGNNIISIALWRFYWDTILALCGLGIYFHLTNGSFDIYVCSKIVIYTSMKLYLTVSWSSLWMSHRHCMYNILLKRHLCKHILKTHVLLPWVYWLAWQTRSLSSCGV